MTVRDAAASRAVFIGIDAYTHPDLAPLPAAAAGAHRLAALVCDGSVWGLPAGHVTVLGADTSVEQVLAAVRDAAREATDTILVYFAGHGLRDRNDQLYLAMANADADHPQIATLAYRSLRDVLRQAGHRARYRIAVLDCCYSGLAGNMSSTTVPSRADLAHALGESSKAAPDGKGDRGDCVLTSAPPTKQSFVPVGAKFPEFTGELISVIENGIVGAGPLVSVEDIWRWVHRRMRERASPAPQQFDQNAVARQVRIYNRAAGRRYQPWHFPLRGVATSPVVAAEKVYVVDHGLTLHALDAATGIRRWQQPIHPWGALSAANDMVYLGGYYDGILQARQAATGVLCWERDTTGKRIASMAIADGVVCVGSNVGVHAFDAVTGTMLWTHPSKCRVAYLTAIDGAVYVSEDGVGSGFWRVYAIDAMTSSLRWSCDQICRIDSAPVVANGIVYVSSRDGGSIRAFDAVTGGLLWAEFITDEGGMPPAPAVRNGVLYIGGGGFALGLDAATGSTGWMQIISWNHKSIPVMTEDAVYLADERKLYALASDTGTVRWTVDLDGIGRAPVVMNGMLYVSAADGVYAFDTKGGAPRLTRGIESY